MKPAKCPRILDRLKAILGSYGRVTVALDVAPNYATRWAREGFIPEVWALDVEDLHLQDEWGAITARDVLFEARAGRTARHDHQIARLAYLEKLLADIDQTAQASRHE